MNSEKNKSTNRSFGIVFFTVFLIVGIYPMLNEEDVRLWSLIISVIFLMLGILNSEVLTPLNKIWFRFGIFLGKIFSPLIMALIFFFVVTPIGLMMRFIGKDVLNLKFNDDKSYWVEKRVQKVK